MEKKLTELITIFNKDLEIEELIKNSVNLPEKIADLEERISKVEGLVTEAKEKNDYINTTLKESITTAIQLGYAIKKAETQAQLKSLESNEQQCFKLFSTAFWSLGSFPSININEYHSYLEDMICASAFNYLDKHSPEKLRQLFQSQLPSILLSNDEQSDCDTSKVMNEDFEYFLNTLRS